MKVGIGGLNLLIFAQSHRIIIGIKEKHRKKVILENCEWLYLPGLIGDEINF